jgi:hypothetical protein
LESFDSENLFTAKKRSIWIAGSSEILYCPKKKKPVVVNGKKRRRRKK